MQLLTQNNDPKVDLWINCDRTYRKQNRSTSKSSLHIKLGFRNVYSELDWNVHKWQSSDLKDIGSEWCDQLSWKQLLVLPQTPPFPAQPVTEWLMERPWKTLEPWRCHEQPDSSVLLSSGHGGNKSRIETQTSFFPGKLHLRLEDPKVLLD